MTPAALAASFTPISADFQLNAWSLLSVVLALATVLGYYRRKPAVDVDLATLQGSITNLQKSVDALTQEHKRHAGHEAEIEQLKSQVRELRAQRETDGHNQRSYIAKLSREIFEKIEAQGEGMDSKLETLSLTINKEFRDLYRALGKAEGQLEHA